jgi:hypothetical protein
MMFLSCTDSEQIFGIAFEEKDHNVCVNILINNRLYLRYDLDYSHVNIIQLLDFPIHLTIRKSIYLPLTQRGIISFWLRRARQQTGTRFFAPPGAGVIEEPEKIRVWLGSLLPFGAGVNKENLFNICC